MSAGAGASASHPASRERGRGALFAGAGRRLWERFELGDVLVFLYALAFARQYLWAAGSGGAAWALAAALALLFTYFYVKTKPFAPAGSGASFWLAVALPLAVIYALRAPFPDLSFDVLNYRLFHAERALAGPPFAPGDFFPTPAPYNPAPDMVTGLLRHLLGYRLGTVVNLFALVWAAQVVDRLLRGHVGGAWRRAGCVMLVMLAEHLLFEVNTYMGDLLALPLMCEALYLLLRAGEAAGRVGLYARVALLCGAAAAFKLTNLTSILPLVLAAAALALAGRARLAPKQLPKAALLSFAAFAAPLAPFTAYIYAKTGNPLFPLFNGFFKSPYWPTSGGWDSRWGPSGAFETLLWPALSFFEPARHSELGVYSGRLALGLAASIVGLALARGRADRAGRGGEPEGVGTDRVLLTTSAVTLLGLLLWSAAGMGYSRYGLFLEILSGVVVVAAAARAASSFPAVRRRAGAACAALMLAVLAAQAALACYYVSRYEWGMRPTALSDFAGYAAESRLLLRDRDLASRLAPGDRALLSGAKVWADLCPKSNGFEALLDSSAPALGLRHHEFFASRAARREFVRALEAGAGRPLLALCLPEDLSDARRVVAERGFAVVSATPVRVPFFSTRHPIDMTLLAVEPPRGERGREWAEEFWLAAAFPDEDYRADISIADPPAAMRPGERRTLAFRVRNAGDSSWPARGREGRFQVNLGDRWLDGAEDAVVNDLDARTALPADLEPGAEVGLTLSVTAPARPGEYVLEIDMVHEGVTFFREKGSRPLRLRVRVG